MLIPECMTPAAHRFWQLPHRHGKRRLHISWKELDAREQASRCYSAYNCEHHRLWSVHHIYGYVTVALNPAATHLFVVHHFYIAAMMHAYTAIKFDRFLEHLLPVRFVRQASL